jgi:hypothetical protein
MRTPASPPIYAVLDRRHGGVSRIVSEHVDPESAGNAADLLRHASAPVEIVLITTILANEMRDAADNR